MEGRSAKAFEALAAINDEIQVKALRDGNACLLAQAEVVVGDILLLGQGDKIPADGRLLHSIDLFVDESTLTGESMPVKKEYQCEIDIKKVPLAERVNRIYAGTYLTNGSGKVLVTEVGNQTEFGKIASELTIMEQSSTPLQEKLARLGKIITILGVIAATIVFISEVLSFFIQNMLSLENILEAFVTSIVLIVDRKSVV